MNKQAAQLQPVRVGIVGYGNLGRGVEAALALNPDMTAVGIYTRRKPNQIKPACVDLPVYAMDNLPDHKGQLDLLILCGGSKDDLSVQSPQLAEHFCLVDSFDTHARIPEHFAAVDAVAKANNKTALICAGWDPGLFSINRLFGEAFLPDGDTYTFWGKGLSQGHSDAIRRLHGVADGVQYTQPVEEAVELVRSGVRPLLSTREKHHRECFVVLQDGADPEAVQHAIITMPHYFDQYDTTVHFIDTETLRREHGTMPHGGFVIRSGNTSADNRQVMEFRIQLDSNPEFTASVLVAYARAVYRMHQSGQYGCKTVLDVPPGLLSPKSALQLRSELL